MAERRLARGSLQRSRLGHGWQVFGGVVAAIMLWFGTPEVLRRLEFFRVRRVEIEGSRYLVPAKITAALGLHDRSSVFDDLPA
ncbi:MAG TPA: hypothetical protein VHH32_02910, partial [Gemmatimonadales bacterium]|nr:hypothetical protein [Gemmatimonadales bacterium]